MANRLIANGTGYVLTDSAPPSGYGYIKVNGRYLWGYPARVNNTGNFWFIKNGTKYYGLLQSAPSGTLTSGAMTVPAGVNRVKYHVDKSGTTNVSPNDTINIYTSTFKDGNDNTMIRVEMQLNGVVITACEVYEMPDDIYVTWGAGINY